MANGDVHDQVSDQYLKQFDRSVGVSGMQKLQSFPELQKLGHAGTLSHQKKDFHGLQDFKSQMAKYSHVSHTLRIAWALISFIVPNNPSIQKQLMNAPGLGSVGNAFKSIHGFGQVFSLSPSDLKSPAAVQSKASVYKNQSVQASVVTDYSTQEAIGGGASPTSPGNASALNGFLIVGTPTSVNNSLSFDHVTGNLVWGPGGGGGGGGSSTLADDTDVLITSPSNGQFLVYSSGDGKWENHSLVAGDIPSLPESRITGLVSDLATLASAVTSEASTRASADTGLATAITAETSRATTAEALAELLSHKDAASGYAGLTAGGLLKAAEFPTPTTSTFGGVKDKTAVTHNFVTSIVNGIPILAQPDYSDLTGTPTLAQTIAAVTSNWLRSYDSSTGAFTASQPTFTDLAAHPTTIAGYGITDALSSGTVLPATKTLIAHQYFVSYDSSTGLFTSAQPAFTDISGTAGLAQGGTGVDLSASGGTTKILAQDSSHVISARNLVSGDIPDLSGTYLKRDGTVAMTGALDMGTHLINNVVDPSSAQDAATKSYVDASFTTGSMVMSVNSQTGTTYTVLNSDRAKLLTFNNASAVAVALPQAGVGGSFNNTWFAYFQNIGNGPVTITPTTSTIDTGTSIVLFRGQGVLVASDGSNYSLNSGRVSRFATYSVTTASLAAAATENDSITMPKAGLLYTLDVTSAKKCRIRLYSTSAARTADASRSYQVPPVPGTQHGVLADFYFDQSTAVTPWMCSPAVILFNNDATPARTIYVAITNIDTSSQAITTTFSVVPLES